MSITVFVAKDFAQMSELASEIIINKTMARPLSGKLRIFYDSGTLWTALFRTGR